MRKAVQLAGLPYQISVDHSLMLHAVLILELIVVVMMLCVAVHFCLGSTWATAQPLSVVLRRWLTLPL
jgi:hypothetical protein